MQHRVWLLNSKTVPSGSRTLFDGEVRQIFGQHGDEAPAPHPFPSSPTHPQHHLATLPHPLKPRLNPLRRHPFPIRQCVAFPANAAVDTGVCLGVFRLRRVFSGNRDSATSRRVTVVRLSGVPSHPTARIAPPHRQTARSASPSLSCCAERSGVAASRWFFNGKRDPATAHKVT